MAKEVFMPKLGMTMETGTILEWAVKEGDEVSEGDVLLEVMTNKINIEVEAYESGTLLKTYFQDGDEVPVNQVIAYIGEKGEQVPEEPPALGEAVTQSEETTSTAPDEKKEKVAEADQRKPGKIRATPAARKLSRESDLDLQQIAGSGARGRIHVADVRKHLETKDTQAPQATQPKKSESQRIKVEGMRKTIGQRMRQSFQEIPHVTLHTEVDMSQTVSLRKELLPIIEEKTGFRLSYTEIILKAVATSLRDHPMVRASLNKDEIHIHDEIHIGLAVSHPQGLLVPVIHSVDQLGFAELTITSKRLARDAREGKLSPDHLQGGVFTVSNLGMYRVDQFTPIINQPETAILGVGRIQEKPVGVDGEIELRPMMALSLSFDHRIIDGAPAADFLTQVVDILEHPSHLLV